MLSANLDCAVFKSLKLDVSSATSCAGMETSTVAEKTRHGSGGEGGSLGAHRAACRARPAHLFHLLAEAVELWQGQRAQVDLSHGDRGVGDDTGN
jgi:hypothetical protein